MYIARRQGKTIGWSKNLGIRLTWHKLPQNFAEELPEVHQWLLETVGPENEGWTYNISAPSTCAPHNTLTFAVFFRSIDHLTMFKLAFGGKLVRDDPQRFW